MNQEQSQIAELAGEVSLEPPAELFDTKLDEFTDLPASNETAAVIREHVWPHRGRPQGWQVARLSKAVYLFRETGSHWTVVAKFYSVKSRPAEQYALREKERIDQAQALGLADGPYRTVRCLDCRRGVIFLEHVAGLSLFDAVAIRRGRPGSLPLVLERVAQLLCRLHTGGRQLGAQPDFAPAIKKAEKYVGQLAKYGVLKHEPTISDGLMRLLEPWAMAPGMMAYTPTLTHGDATSANFLLPDDDSVVAIDWETMAVRDPAFDLGRLAAEVSHCVEQHGGQGEEAAAIVERLYQAYLCRLARLALVGQAMAMLARPGEDW